MNNLSLHNFVAPYKLMGEDALSVDNAIIFFTLLFCAQAVYQNWKDQKDGKESTPAVSDAFDYGYTGHVGTCARSRPPRPHGRQGLPRGLQVQGARARRGPRAARPLRALPHVPGAQLQQAGLSHTN